MIVGWVGGCPIAPPLPGGGGVVGTFVGLWVCLSLCRTPPDVTPPPPPFAGQLPDANHVKKSGTCEQLLLTTSGGGGDEVQKRSQGGSITSAAHVNVRLPDAAVWNLNRLPPLLLTIPHMRLFLPPSPNNLEYLLAASRRV